MRLGAEFHDEQDIRYLLRYLNVADYSQALGIIEQYYPLQRFPQKTLYALQELLQFGEIEFGIVLDRRFRLDQAEDALCRSLGHLQFREPAAELLNRFEEQARIGQKRDQGSRGDRRVDDAVELRSLGCRVEDLARDSANQTE